ncbi:Protein Wnt-2b [Lamellibrachia satsuma]|nr:Protein Wnt-2b [Lamellibrachia satsuma]
MASHSTTSLSEMACLCTRPAPANRAECANNMPGDTGAVETSLQTACKCHGVSGSCSIKTCWKALADMTTIGGVLLKRYAVAVEAKSRRMKKLGGEKKLVSVARKRLVADTDLVYCRKSPDYCLPDASRGSVGTHGRECKKGDPGSSGCQLMCCGRGITSRVVRVRHRCDCKYYWCCYVKCKTCIKDVVVHRCR